MKNLIKHSIVDDLNTFMKSHDMSINQMFDIVMNHEALPVDKTKPGLRKKIETLRVELEYQKIIKELQELDYDRVSVQREMLADFLCDLMVRISLEFADNIFDENASVPVAEIVKLKNEYLKMFAIKEELFQEIYEKQLNTAREQREKANATRMSTPAIFNHRINEVAESHSDQVIDQMNADEIREKVVDKIEGVLDEIDEYASRHDPALGIPDVTTEVVPDPAIQELAKETIQAGNEIHHELDGRVDKLKMMSENLKHHHEDDLKEYAQDEVAEAREEQRAIDSETEKD